MHNQPVHNKFVILKDVTHGGMTLVIARCTFHNQITGPIDQFKKCISGGWWEWDRKEMKIRFYGESDQFGWYEWDHLNECIQKGEVYTNSYKTRKFDLSGMTEITATDHRRQEQNKLIKIPNKTNYEI